MTGEAPRTPQRALGDRDDFPEWMDQVMSALDARSGTDGAEPGATGSDADQPRHADDPPRRRRFLRRSGS